MHLVGEGVGFFRRIFAVVFVIRFTISLVIRFVISVQRFLQLLKLGGLHKRFDDRFDGLGPRFRVGLRFFVLGFDQLLAEGGYLFFGKVRDMRVRDDGRTCFGIKPVEIAGDFFFRVRRSLHIFRDANNRPGTQAGHGRFMLFRYRGGWRCEERSRQSRGNFLIRILARGGGRGGSSRSERRMLR